MEEEALTTVEPIKYKECVEEARNFSLAFLPIEPYYANTPASACY